MASIADITDRIRAAAAKGPSLGKTLKLDFKGEGVIFIDGSAVTNEDAPADCTIRVSKDDLVAIAKGQLDPASAFFKGRLRVQGDMTLAMRLPTLLADRA